MSRGMLLPALGHLGAIEEARQVWSDLKKINPRYSFAAHLARQRFHRQADVDTIRSGFAKAGIKE
jgi:adenylate cyclase